LTYINNAFSSITIGSATSTVAIGIDYAAAAFTFTNPVALRSNTGNIAAVDTLRTGTNSLTLSTGGSINLVGVLSGALSVTGSAITLNNDITTSGGQSYTGPVSLASNITLDSGSSGAVGFSSTVNSANSTARNLNVTAGSGNVTFTGALGNTNALGAIAIDTTGITTFGSSVNAASVTTNTGGTTALNGNITTTGALTFNDAVSLTNAVTLNADSLRFVAAVSSGSANSALTITTIGDLILGGNITTTRNQTYNSDVTVAGNIALTSTAGNILFAKKVLSQANSSYSLAVSAVAGLVTITDSVGIAVTTTGSVLPTTHALRNFTVTAENIHILGDVLTRNDQLFTGAISIGDNGTKGALYEYYLTLLDPLEIPVLDDPIYARTLISIDPSITFAGTVDDLVPNTHSLYAAAISHLAPSDAGFLMPTITFDAEIGKTNPLYSINLLTMQNTNPTAYVGNLFLKGEVNTFSDQTYRTNTLTADPLSPLTSMTFTVDDMNAKISFDLFKADPVGTEEGIYSFTNTDGDAILIFNGPTTFNGETTIPTFPTDPSVRWSTVTQGMSLSALAASRRGNDSDSRAVAQETAAAPAPISTPRIDPRIGLIPRHELDGAATLASIIGNNNFEIPKAMIEGNVNVSMGTPARTGSMSRQTMDNVPFDSIKRGEDCQLASADCEEEQK
jgi:hypothetical protein